VGLVGLKIAVLVKLNLGGWGGGGDIDRLGGFGTLPHIKNTRLLNLKNFKRGLVWDGP